MFKQEYQKVFSQVTASGDVYRRVLNMKQQENKKYGMKATTKVLLAAVMVCLLAVTASAAGLGKWFVSYFEQANKKELSQEQQQWVTEQEKFIGQAQTRNGWTMELRSAITDGRSGYILLGVTAPEGQDLTQMLGGSGYYGPGNDFLFKSENKVLSCSEGFFAGRVGGSWQEDGDGKNNTLHYVIDFTPELLSEEEASDLLKADVTWHIHIEDLVKGDPAEEVLAEGTWDFDFCFPAAAEPVELLAEDIQMEAPVALPGSGEERHTVTLHSVQLRALGVTASYEVSRDIIAEDMQMVYFGKDAPWTLVMKDGEEIVLTWYDTNPVQRTATFSVSAPVLTENVESLRLGDGTVIPVMQERG